MGVSLFNPGVHGKIINHTSQGVRALKLFEIRNLSSPQHHNLELKLHAGECVTLSGESGSGKTLLLRYLADLQTSEGDMLLDGISCRSIPAPQWRRQVMLLPTESAWWENTVGAHFPEQPDPQLMEKLQLSSAMLAKSPDDLSSGERQRLALLRVLNLKPQVLLLDEITANLDPANTLNAENLVLQYLHDHQAAALWISHDAAQVKRLGGRHFALHEGHLYEEPPA